MNQSVFKRGLILGVCLVLFCATSLILHLFSFTHVIVYLVGMFLAVAQLLCSLRLTDRRRDLLSRILLLESLYYIGLILFGFISATDFTALILPTVLSLFILLSLVSTLRRLQPTEEKDENS